MTFKSAPGTNRGPWMPASLQYLRTLAVTFAFSLSAFPLGALFFRYTSPSCAAVGTSMFATGTLAVLVP